MSSILFVDDDAAFLEGIGRMFRKCAEKYPNRPQPKVYLAHGVRKAIKILKEHRIEMTVTELRMKVVDGQQFLRLLHKHYPKMQKVVLTGVGSYEQRNSCLDAGAGMFLEKPRTREEALQLFEVLTDAVGATGKKKGFTGMLPGADLKAAVNRLCMEGASVIVEVKTSSCSGKIYLNKGLIIHSQTERLEGVDAFNELMTEEGGEFILHTFRSPPKMSMTPGSWEYLHGVAPTGGTRGSRPAAPGSSSRPASPGDSVAGRPVAPAPGRRPAPSGQSVGSGAGNRPAAPPGSGAGSGVLGRTSKPTPTPSRKPKPAQGGGSSKAESDIDQDIRLRHDPDQLDDSLIGALDDEASSGQDADDSSVRPSVPSVNRPETTIVEEAYDLDVLDEYVVCTSAGEVIDQRDADDPEMRVDLVDFVAIKASQLGHELGLGNFTRLEIHGEGFRAAARVTHGMNGFARVAGTQVETDEVGHMLAQAMSKAGASR